MKTNISFQIVFILFNMFLFSACNDVDNQKQNLDENNTTKIYTSLLYQQWYLDKNDTFYTQNNIDENAHINIKNNFKNYSGKGIKIAIIDNGFDVNHPEIRNNIIKTASFDNNGNYINANVSHELSWDYHGTAVAGIIVANKNNGGLIGIAPDAELILIKHPYNTNKFSENTIINMFKYAINNGADIINCSWNSIDITSNVINYINNIANTARDGKGVIIVFSSGNDGNNDINDIAKIKNVISVGATNKYNKKSTYSNSGKELDIVAPGGEYIGITTIDPISNKGVTNTNYNHYNDNKKFIGTSASTPIITACIALALQIDVNITNINLREILSYSTQIIDDKYAYLDDMITSSNLTPKITGYISTNSNTNIGIKLISKDSNATYGVYNISVNGDNTFFCNVCDILNEGKYMIEIIDIDSSKIIAVDDNFEINTSKSINTNIKKRKNNFYGYGKIDLDKFLSNIFDNK